VGLGSLRAESPQAISLRVMTYNIHSCKGRDGKVRPDRIVQVIREYHPDVVALQEVRVGRVDVKKPTEGVIEPPVGEPPLLPPTVIEPRDPSKVPADPVPFTDQPRAIADALGMRYVFYPLVRTERTDFGIAILSRYPLHLVRASNLPTLPRRKPLEQRGALWAEVKVGTISVQVLTTHLGLNSRERDTQVDALLGKEWLGSEKFTKPFVLCGDFNARPSQSPYKRLTKFTLDAPSSLGKDKTKKTWPSRFPVFRIDHVFIPKSSRALSAEVPKNSLTKTASDHLPVIVDLALK
jgi:endonuclease/exonuclease/phosphatase family metal-dependent hydrolase